MGKIVGKIEEERGHPFQFSKREKFPKWGKRVNREKRVKRGKRVKREKKIPTKEAVRVAHEYRDYLKGYGVEVEEVNGDE